MESVKGEIMENSVAITHTGALRLLHLNSFVKTNAGEAQTLCDLKQAEVLSAGGVCFSTIEDLEEACTPEERSQQRIPATVCEPCLKLGLAIPLRRAFKGRVGR